MTKYYFIQCEICGHLNENIVEKLPQYTNCPQCKKHRNYEYWELPTVEEFTLAVEMPTEVKEK